MKKVKSEKLESEKVESDTPRTEMMLSKPTPRDQIVDFARKMERENSQLRDLLGDLCVAVCRRMSAEDPFPPTVRALFDAYKAADAYLSQPSA